MDTHCHRQRLALLHTRPDDEVLHEQYYPVILEAMNRYQDDPRVEGLLFRYHLLRRLPVHWRRP